MVPEWRVGQRVMVQPGLSCGRCAACLAGEDNYCPRYDVLGYQSAGGYAELVAVPAANLIALPDHVSDVEAAAFPLSFLTAWHMLTDARAYHGGRHGAGAGGRKRRGAGGDSDGEARCTRA